MKACSQLTNIMKACSQLTNSTLLLIILTWNLTQALLALMMVSASQGIDDFSRVKLLQAHISLSNYDIISLCEISLNYQMEIPSPLKEGYNFESL